MDWFELRVVFGLVRVALADSDRVVYLAPPPLDYRGCLPRVYLGTSEGQEVFLSLGRDDMGLFTAVSVDPAPSCPPVVVVPLAAA